RTSSAFHATASTRRSSNRTCRVSNTQAVTTHPHATNVGAQLAPASSSSAFVTSGHLLRHLTPPVRLFAAHEAPFNEKSRKTPPRKARRTAPAVTRSGTLMTLPCRDCPAA